MTADLQTVQIVVGIIVGLLMILSTIFGWFGKLWRWLTNLFGSKPSPAVIDIPKKTIILLPEPHPNAFWWHMGSFGGKPAMQIVGDLKVTNICKYKVLITAAKLRKPKAFGHALVRDLNSNSYGGYMIPEGGVTDLRFDFWVLPPVKEKGQVFKADIAILDQFGNEHWVKGIEFKYT